MSAPALTPAARRVCEAVHAGAVLTMHLRRDDRGQNVPRYLLEPAGRVVCAPTAEVAIRTPYLAPSADALFAGAQPQTWTAGDAVPPPKAKRRRAAP